MILSAAVKKIMVIEIGKEGRKYNMDEWEWPRKYVACNLYGYANP